MDGWNSVYCAHGGEREPRLTCFTEKVDVWMYLVLGLDVELDLFAREGADSVGNPGHVSFCGMRWVLRRQRGKRGEGEKYLMFMVSAVTVLWVVALLGRGKG